MDWVDPVLSFVVLNLSVCRIAVGIWLMAAPLPLRDGARWRIPLCLLSLAAIYALLSALFVIPRANGFNTSLYLGQLVAFSLLLVSAIGLFLVVYDTSIWTAIFCCTAGYTIQNLTSGTTELLWTLARGAAPFTEGFYSPLRMGISIVCVVVVYGLSYLLITRYLLRTGLGRLEDRSLIAMMVMVIFVIIGFDLVVKWLTDQGVSVVVVVLLRLFHGLACAFTLTTEFELLVRRRLEAERDVMERVLAERRRQYELARDTIAAIDARIHDIRHSVARLAYADGLDARELRDLLGEVKLYDSQVRTGNDALDTVLTEQGLRFARANAGLSCIADGTALAFMTPADVYTLFSALLDGMLSTGTTSASLVVRETLGSASVHLEHIGSSPAGDALHPASDIVSRYQGTLTTMEKGGVFHLNILFPTR